MWKPSDTAILSNYWIYQIFKEAGFPDGLVNFVPADGPVFGKTVTGHKELGAINFTGSVPYEFYFTLKLSSHIDVFVNDVCKFQVFTTYPQYNV